MERIVTDTSTATLLNHARYYWRLGEEDLARMICTTLLEQDEAGQREMRYEERIEAILIPLGEMSE